MKYILSQKISEHLYDAKEYYDRLNKHFRTIGHDRRVGTYDETKVVVKNASITLFLKQSIKGKKSNLMILHVLVMVRKNSMFM